MMSEIKNNNIIYILWSAMSGMISFFISGVIASLVILHFNNYILGLIIAGGIGGLLLGFFHWKQRMILRMTFASLIAVIIGFFGSFMLVEGLVGGIRLLFPSVAAQFLNSTIPDIMAIILMGIVFGIIFGAIVYGRIAIGLFSIVCGVVAIPFGLLVGALNSELWIKAWLENVFKIFGNIDLNMLVIILEFGMGVGLSIGLYNYLKQKNIEHR